MVIAVLTVEYHLHGNDSLKGKRRVANSLKQKVRNTFNVAIAEYGTEDSLTRLRLMVISLSNSEQHLQSRMDKCLAMMEAVCSEEMVYSDLEFINEQDMQTAHIIQPAEEMAAIIQQFDNIVIVAHGSPDGDAIGATGAMGSLVKALGKRFVLYNATGIPDYLEWVPLPGKLVTKPSAIPFKPGLIIVLDCGDAWRMGKELLAVFPE